MPSVFFTTGALKQAATIQTAYANLKIRLFQVGAITLTPATPIADLEALEADYTGYVEATVVAMLGPFLAPGSGALIQTPLVVFEPDAPFTITNSIMGWWAEDAAGVLICGATYPEPIPMEGAGNVAQVSFALPFGPN